MTDNQKKKTGDNKIYGVYIRSVLTQRVSLFITEIGQNIKEILEQKLIQANENKCVKEGFIKPGSVRIIQYSSGQVNAEWITFETVFECMLCHPVEGMLIECVVKTITKAGIHAEVVYDNAVPVVVFIAKDHHNMNKNFNTVVENQRVVVKVIGARFELNDPHISVIAQLLDEKDNDDAKTRRKVSGGLAKLKVYDDDDEAMGGVAPDNSDDDE